MRALNTNPRPTYPRPGAPTAPPPAPETAVRFVIVPPVKGAELRIASHLTQLLDAAVVAERCLTRTAADERDINALRRLRAAIQATKESQ